MKSLITLKISSLIVILALTLLVSCKKEDEVPVQFKVESITPSDGNKEVKIGQTVTIVFSKKIKFVKGDFFVDYPANTDFPVTAIYDGDRTVSVVIGKSSSVSYYKNREFYLGVTSVAADGELLPVYPMNGTHEFYAHYWFSSNQ
jgi:hypothetical protein